MRPPEEIVARALSVRDENLRRSLKERVDGWAHSFDLVPVLLGHDVHKPVGWVTRAKLRRDSLLLLGERHPSFDPHSRVAGRVVRNRVISGLSPLVSKSQGSRAYADGRWGPGEVYSFAELSVVGTPRVPQAHWEAPGR